MLCTPLEYTGEGKKKTNETIPQAQNNVYFSLNTQSVIRVQQVGVAECSRTYSRQKQSHTVKIQAFDNHSIFNRGQCCPKQK